MARFIAYATLIVFVLRAVFLFGFYKDAIEVVLDLLEKL